MPHTSRKTAQRLKEADVIRILQQSKSCAQLFPDYKSTATRLGPSLTAGVAAVTLPNFRRKLNRVVGYGLGGSISKGKLGEVETMFVKNGEDVSVRICPLTDTSALDLLFSNGHSVDRFLDSYARVLSGEDLTEKQMERVQISRVGPEDAEEFVRQSVDGYQDLCRAETVSQKIARSAILRDDTTDYVATVDGKVAASAGMALIETSLGGVAHVAFDSTLPAFRGRGIQAALLNARFADAEEAGFDLETCALARPGNGIYRNL